MVTFTVTSQCSEKTLSFLNSLTLERKIQTLAVFKLTQIGHIMESLDSLCQWVSDKSAEGWSPAWCTLEDIHDVCN